MRIPYVLTTVDFALTYFVVSGELERSGVPCNLIINDAGGLSVLTSWAAGKFSSTSISKFTQENVEPKIKCRKLVIPGKVAVLKGDIEAKLPGWEVIVAPNEAVQLVKFLKDLKAQRRNLIKESSDCRDFSLMVQIISMKRRTDHGKIYYNW